jgi:hypothetical protein
MDLAAELEAIRRRHGALTPALVVAEARNLDSPLHSMVFNKTQSEAAEAYYLERARDLIQSVRVVYKKPNGERSSLRQYYSVRREDGHAFERLEDVREDPFARQLILTNMEREWRALRRQYGELVEFWEMVKTEANDQAA